LVFAEKGGHQFRKVNRCAVFEIALWVAAFVAAFFLNVSVAETRIRTTRSGSISKGGEVNAL